MSRPKTAREPMPKGYWVLWSAVVIDMVGFGIAIPVLGPYAEKLGGNGLWVGAIGAAFSAMQFLMAKPLGRLSDRIGRKPVMVMSMLGTAVASLFTGLANALWVLLVARAFDGASGATIGVAQAAVADIAPPRRRAALMGMMGAAFGIGFTVGPALGALAAWLGNRRTPFFVAAAIAFINAIATWIRVPETRGLAQAEASDAAASGKVGLARRWNENGLQDLLLVVFVTGFAFAGFEQMVTLFLKKRLGFGERGAGLTFTFVGLCLIVAQGYLVGRVVPRFGEYRVLITGCIGVIGGMIILAITHHWWMLIPQVILVSIGQGLVMPSMSSTVTARIDPTKRGELMGVQQSFGSLARVAGPLVAGLLFDHIDIAAPFIMAAVLYGLGVVLVSRAKRNTKVVLATTPSTPAPAGH